MQIFHFKNQETTKLWERLEGMSRVYTSLIIMIFGSTIVLQASKYQLAGTMLLVIASLLAIYSSFAHHKIVIELKSRYENP